MRASGVPVFEVFAAAPAVAKVPFALAGVEATAARIVPESNGRAERQSAKKEGE